MKAPVVVGEALKNVVWQGLAAKGLAGKRGMVSF